MDGYELIARLRALPRAANVPAIALTGFGRAQDAAKAVSTGFDGHLGKPVSLDALLDMLGRTRTLTLGKSVQDAGGRRR